MTANDVLGEGWSRPCEVGNHGPVVFISYRHSELGDGLAEGFRRRLLEAGYDVFVDKTIGWGRKWTFEIHRALESCNYLLLLLSREAAQSEFVWAEVELARQLSEERNGRPTILPIRVRLPAAERLPYHLAARLAGIQHREWMDDRDTEALVVELIALLGNNMGARSPAETAARAQAGAGTVSADASDPIMEEQGPGGAMGIASPLYIERAADAALKAIVARRRALATIKAPRQMGKTSMVFRTLAAARRNGLRTAFIDFQSLQGADLSATEALWRGVAQRVATQLQLREWRPHCWGAGLGHDYNLNRFLAEHVFASDGRDLILCFDEADRLFASPLRDEFFGSLRALYNFGAMDPLWSKLRWLLITSTEPGFFIADVNQSPFNVGQQIDLKPFSPAQVAELAGRLGLTLDAATTAELYEYFGGHPYLTHRALFEAAEAGFRGPKIADVMRPERFRDHLHRFLIQFQSDRVLAEAMREILAGRPASDARGAERLRAAGLIRSRGGADRPACRLYAEFFVRELAT